MQSLRESHDDLISQNAPVELSDVSFAVAMSGRDRGSPQAFAGSDNDSSHPSLDVAPNVPLTERTGRASEQYFAIDIQDHLLVSSRVQGEARPSEPALADDRRAGPLNELSEPERRESNDLGSPENTSPPTPAAAQPP